MTIGGHVLLSYISSDYWKVSLREGGLLVKSKDHYERDTSCSILYLRISLVIHVGLELTWRINYSKS